jgi:uncharacterized protein YodC (DUF2158 family)
MENKYKTGDMVYSKLNPGVTLVVRRFVDEIYYCRLYDDPTQKEQVYFERELFSKQAGVLIDPAPGTG